MKEHVNEGDSIIGKLMIFEGRKVGNIHVYRKGGKHRGQRAKLEDGICWIEKPISLPRKK